MEEIANKVNIHEESLSVNELYQIKPNKGTPQKSIFFTDVISEDQNTLFETLLPAPAPQSIQDIEDYYNQMSFDDLSTHEIFSHSKSASNIHFPLHLAARDGDCDQIEVLVNDGFGYDINQKDARSVTPLHVAALFGQNEAVKTLIKLNATVDVKGYEDHTPLQFALHKKHFDVAFTLVTEGKADPLLQDSDGLNSINLLMDSLPELLTDAHTKSDLESQNKLDDAFKLLQVIMSQATEPLMYNEIAEIDGEKYIAPIPLPIVLQFIASYATTTEQANKLLDFIQIAQSIDNSNTAYINAKDLLHQFPTGGIYPMSYTKDKKIWFLSEGHSGILTTELAAQSLQAFLKDPHFDNQNSLKTEIFTSLSEIYNQAKDFALIASTEETANKALELYDQGKTVLLPSGWDGHFIDVILSKPQLMYVVANSGDRYHGESPDYNPDPAGINFYRIYEPDAISPQFMYNVLNNSVKSVLEFENAYEYGVFERIEEISRADQQYGNCGWESHRDAVEGLIYIELLNKNINSDEAKAIAAAYYQEWDDFHGDFVIDRFISDNPLLPIEALFDIFNEIHLKDNYSDADHSHAQKIADALTSDHYISAFQDWIKDSSSHDLSDKLMLNILKVQHGIDVNGILENGQVENNVESDHDVDSASFVAANIVQPENHTCHCENAPELILIEQCIVPLEPVFYAI